MELFTYELCSACNSLNGWVNFKKKCFRYQSFQWMPRNSIYAFYSSQKKVRESENLSKFSLTGESLSCKVILFFSWRFLRIKDLLILLTIFYIISLHYITKCNLCIVVKKVFYVLLILTLLLEGEKVMYMIFDLQLFQILNIWIYKLTAQLNFLLLGLNYTGSVCFDVLW